MERSDIESIVGKLKKCGVDSYVLRVEGGNLNVFHGKEDKISLVEENYLVAVRNTKNYALPGDKQFDMLFIPYDTIDNMKTIGLSFVETVNVLKELGINDNEINTFLQGAPERRSLTVNTPTYATVIDKNGNITVNEGPGYVVEGATEVRTKDPVKPENTPTEP